MAGPRLLDKRVVNTEVATQKKQQIDAGIQLAQKVDAIRKTKEEEERDLELFRTETISRVQKDIDAKVQERDTLERKNQQLRIERIQLQAPIDLTKEWESVREGRREVESWKEQLTNQSVEQLAKEGELEEKGKTIAKQFKETVRKEELAERTLQAAESRFEEASLTLDKARNDSQRLLETAQEKEKQVVQRQLLADECDRSLTEREKANQEHEIDLANREKALKVRYDTFVKAQNYLKNKKK